MTVPTPELSSLATGLEEITQRVADIADRVAGSPESRHSGELFALERSLRAACRHMDRLLSSR